MAFALDWASLYNAFYSPTTQFAISGPSYSPSSPGPGFHFNPSKISEAKNSQGQLQSLSLSISFNYVAGAYNQAFTCVFGMVRHMTYGGTSAAKLYIRTNWTAKESQNTNIPLQNLWGQMPCALAITTTLGTGSSQQVLQTVDTSLTMQYSGNWSNRGIIGSCEVAPSGNYDVGFTFSINPGYPMIARLGAPTPSLNVYGTLNVLPGTTIAWQQPQTGLTTPT